MSLSSLIQADRAGELLAALLFTVSRASALELSLTEQRAPGMAAPALHATNDDDCLPAGQDHSSR